MDCKERDWRQEADLRGCLFIHDRQRLTWPGAVAAGREQGTKVMDTGSRINICFMRRVKTKTGSEVIPWFLAGVSQEKVH